MAVGGYPMAVGGYPMAVGEYPTAVGGYPMAVGGYPMAVGGYPTAGEQLFRRSPKALLSAKGKKQTGRSRRAVFSGDHTFSSGNSLRAAARREASS